MTLKDLLAVHAKFNWADKLGDAVDRYMFNGEEQQDPELFAEMIFRLPAAHRVKVAAVLLGIPEQRAVDLQADNQSDEERDAALEAALAKGFEREVVTVPGVLGETYERPPFHFEED